MPVIADTFRNFLEDICGTRYVTSDPAVLSIYEQDQTADLRFPFDLLVKPGTPEEISRILQYCSQHGIPVTPRGGGSGVTGGALPVHGGVVLSLERLNRIITINETDGYVIAEAGVITAELCTAAEELGWYYPVPPSSMYASMIGGNVATNAGSIRSCKYGNTVQQVLNLEVVLPDGNIIWTGANVRKNATGFNPTQLFAGSEGTLGVITKVVLRLLPRPQTEVILLAGFSTLQDAIAVIASIKASGLIPSAVELICENALRLTSTYLKTPQPLVQDDINTHLLIEFQEANTAIMDFCVEQLSAILNRHACVEVLVAASDTEKKQVSRLRYAIGEAMNDGSSTYRDVDACMPLSGLYDYIMAVTEICERRQVQLICFGHALDGNLHTMLLCNKNANAAEQERLETTAEEIYRYVTRHGGVLSGEHGIGWLQRAYFPLQYDAARLSLTRNIKLLLDPKNIMNPGKSAFPY